MKKIFNLSLVLSSLIILSGCSIKNQIITQGQTIDSESISQLKLGMTRDQVRLVLGSPSLIDTFDSNQWIYYFSETPINKNTLDKRGRIQLTFKSELLEKIFNNGSLIVESSDANLEGGTVITKPTQRKRGIFNRF